MSNETAKRDRASGAMKPGKEPLAEIIANGLRVDAIDAKPINAEWDAEHLGSEDGWDFWEGSECDECGAVSVSSVGNSECPNGHEQYAEGPMMSYYYPLPDAFEDRDQEEAAKALASLPLCVVRVGSNYGLALTGGGMDLSWEICEAFIRLGYYPPVHFAGKLPRMAGKEHDADAPIIAQVAFDAIQIRARWAMNDANEIARLWKDYFPPGTAHEPA